MGHGPRRSLKIGRCEFITFGRLAEWDVQRYRGPISDIGNLLYFVWLEKTEKKKVFPMYH